jgi:hypothetical protein
MVQTCKGHCPRCGNLRNARIVARYHEHLENDDGDWTDSDYRTLKCQGCGAVYFQREDTFSDDVPYQTVGDGEPVIPSTITTWPVPAKRAKPKWIPTLLEIDGSLYRLVDQAYTALDHELDIFAATGMRTAFDRASELLGIDPAKRFEEKLDDLVGRGDIGKTDKEILDALTDAGSAAAHRGWKPNPAQLETMMSIMEDFLHRAFILHPGARRLKNAVPPRPKRRAKASV